MRLMMQVNHNNMQWQQELNTFRMCLLRNHTVVWMVGAARCENTTHLQADGGGPRMMETVNRNLFGEAFHIIATLLHHVLNLA